MAHSKAMQGSCEMKGFLSFLVIWMISRKSMSGAEIASEIERRKGSRPSPGTIYPVLKDLKAKRLVDVDEKKRYVLTKAGRKELEIQLDSFFNTFSDVDEMKSCCGRH